MFEWTLWQHQQLDPGTMHCQAQLCWLTFAFNVSQTNSFRGWGPA